MNLIESYSHLRSKVLGPGYPNSRSTFRTFNDWMDEYNALLNQRRLTESCPQPLSVSSAALTAQSTFGAHVNLPLPYAQTRSITRSFLGNHPLIIASKATSAGADIQDSQDVD